MTPDKYERFRKWIVLLAWAYFIFMAYMLLHPRPPIDYVPFCRVIKWKHLCAFVVFGGLIGLTRRRWSLGVWFFLTVLWGAGSETLQIFTGRYFEWIDIVHNLVGSAVGLFFATYVRALLLRQPRRARKED